MDQRQVRLRLLALKVLSPRSSGPANCAPSWGRSSLTSLSRRATKASLKAIAAKLSSCSCAPRGFTGFAEPAEPEESGRCCAATTPRWGGILVSRRIAIAVEDSAGLEEIRSLSLKGLS